MLTHVSTMANGSSRFSYTIDSLLQFQSHAVHEDPSWKMSPQVTFDVSCSPIQTFNFIKNLAATPKDALLISVDFEGRVQSDNGTITKYPTEMGIAIFDTRNVETKSSDIDDIRAQELLETFHYQSTKETKRFYKEFRFGTSQSVCPTEFAKILRQLLYMDENLATPTNQTREIILVGHNIFEDIKVMKDLGVDVRSAPSFMGCIDTQYWSSRVTGIALYGNSLTKTMRELGMDRLQHMQHNGGNDANFSLRVMLALFAEDQEMDKDDQTKAELYRRIAKASIPGLGWDEIINFSPTSSDASSDGDSDYYGRVPGFSSDDSGEESGSESSWNSTPSTSPQTSPELNTKYRQMQPSITSSIKQLKQQYRQAISTPPRKSYQQDTPQTGPAGLPSGGNSFQGMPSFHRYQQQIIPTTEGCFQYIYGVTMFNGMEVLWPQILGCTML
jgi:hypothetical protein